MGIKRLKQFLETHTSAVKTHVSLQTIIHTIQTTQRPVTSRRTRVAIDGNLYYYKFSKSRLKDPYVGFANQIRRLLHYNIDPVFVFDGHAPACKKATVHMRNVNRRKFEYINFKHIFAFFDSLNVTCLRPSTEADMFIGWMYQNNLIDFAMTDDFDVLLFGCHRMVTIDKGVIKEFLMRDILQDLLLTPSRFTYMCICMGTDYSSDICSNSNTAAVTEIFMKGEGDDLRVISEAVGGDARKISAVQSLYSLYQSPVETNMFDKKTEEAKIERPSTRLSVKQILDDWTRCGLKTGISFSTLAMIARYANE